MIKYLLICLILLPLGIVFPQEVTDSVDIQKMVAEQIAMAQLTRKQISAEEKIPVKIDEPESENFMGMKLAAILMFSLWGAYILMKKGKKKENKKIVIPAREQVNDIGLIRARLKDSLLSHMGDEEISKTARELNIGKGELYLAALLKAKELNVIASKR